MLGNVCNRLEEIHFENVQISSSDLQESLKNLSSLNTLSTITMTGCSLRSPLLGSIALGVAATKSVSYLDFSNNLIGKCQPNPKITTVETSQ